MLELQLQVNPSGLKMMRMRDRNKAFLPLRQKVITRDASSCQFCGFRGIPKQMRVINLDGNYNNNKIDNMCTACSICTRCTLIGSFETASEHDSVERLIICNELSQIQLNHLYRVLLASMSDATLEHNEVCKTIYRSLRNRAVLVEEMLGKDASDTRVFVQSVLDSGVGEHKNLKLILANLRFFPARNSFHAEWPLWRQYIKKNKAQDISIRLS